MKTIFATIACAVIFLTSSMLHAADNSLALATYLGTTGNESGNGIARQSNGVLVVVGDIGTKQLSGVTQVMVSDATATSPGYVMRIAANGSSILSLLRLPSAVTDVAVDGNDVIHVACGASGYRVISASGTTQLRTKSMSFAWRVDVTSDGRAVVLEPSTFGGTEKPGPGTVHVYASNGSESGSFPGYRNTTDVCIDGASNRVVGIGWRQTNADDGVSVKPVQIAFTRAYSLTGAIAWTNYDWSSTKGDANFINRYQNNMADTRGYRCIIGPDGYLYCAFEAAGGNHIFRWQPNNLAAAAPFASGDRYHTFSNTVSEHKTVFGRYIVSTGARVTSQGFVGRLPNGAGSTVRVKDGSISADASGRVMITGIASSGLPLSYDPLPAGAYTGGAFVLVMNAAFTTRELCTRLSGKGSDATGAAFTSGAVAVVGIANNDLPVTNAFQSTHGGGIYDGFVAIVRTSAGPINVAPSVTLTSPVNAATFTAPATITLSATATDSDGSVTRVEFFAGATKLGEDTSAPYTFTWSNVAAGSYSLTARATDNLGATKSSAPATITVIQAANLPPTVTLTAPANAASFTAPATITISATATDSDGSISRVEFFAGATKLGEDTSAPYTFTWSNVAAGGYSLTARATDNQGAPTTSAAASVTVQPAPTSGDPVSGLASTFQAATFAVGSAVYTDRTFTVQTVLTHGGARQIRTPNNDKANTATSGYLAFTVTTAAEVIVAYDSRATSLPAWLSSFTATGETISTSDVPFQLYRKSFAAGSAVNLGGNLAAGAAGSASNYWLIVQPIVLPDPIAINFQPADVPTVAGYLVDSGATFASRNGQQYGWNQTNDATRDRNVSSDQRMDTLIHMQLVSGLVWELALPNGTYEVHVVCGDVAYTNQVNTLNIEGVVATDPDGQDATDVYTVQVTVNDGRLTITPAAGAVNAKLQYLEIVPVVIGNG